jgi:hypothetical protein
MRASAVVNRHSMVALAVFRRVNHAVTSRGILLLIVAELLHTPLDNAQAVTCDQCQDDLAAYIDLERDAGSVQAIRAHPHVWWHLLICSDCITTYQIVLDSIQKHRVL